MSQKKYKIAESPGTGQFVCQKCGVFRVTVTGPRDQLPPCEKCGHDSDVTYRAYETSQSS